MEAEALHRERPVPTVLTVLSAAPVVVTVAVFAGIVPGVPKTLPLFVDLLAVTALLLIAAGAAWAGSFLGA